MNCLLLPTEYFSQDSAIINNLLQINHVNHVLAAKVGDTLKIGQLGGNLGTAIIEEIAARCIQLGDVQLIVSCATC